LSIIIKDIACHLPSNKVSNSDLHKENPDWNMNQVQERSGVYERYISDEDETALDLAIIACNKLLSKNCDLAEQVDGLIFCTQSPDHIMPPNACILHDRLGFPENVLAFDFNLACSGYIYGLAIARGLIESGQLNNILLVNADTYSKYINKKDRSARALFGDGAAVSWITHSNSEAGIVDSQCATFGKGYDKFIIPAGGLRKPKSNETGIPVTDSSNNLRTQENIYMDGMAVWTFINSKVPKQIKQLLSRNNLGISEIDMFIFHQASKMTLDSLVQRLKIPNKKVFSNLSGIGNTVSASIPFALKGALDANLVQPGHKVILSGFGAGLSWGTVLINY
jgi:3-oxoacyl-[acyl-carrier-protein] synthase III